MIRVGTKSLYLAAFLFLSFNSHAEELIEVHLVCCSVTLRQAIAVSSIVAKIQVTSISPVLDETLRGNNICGFLYGAKIIQSFKGEEGSFSFFMPSRAGSFSPGKNYLAFIKYRTIDEANIIISNLNDVRTESDGYLTKCRFRNGFYVSANSPLVIPFDMDAGKQLGGQWLVDAPGITFCEYKVGFSVENDNFSRKNKSGRVVLNWVEVERLINQSNRWLDFFRKNTLDSCNE